MSQNRWFIKFYDSTFYTQWIGIFEKINNLNLNDSSLSEAVLELARLKKAASYIDSILSSIDPDLITYDLTALNNCNIQLQSQLNQFIHTQQRSHLNAANYIIDSILHIINTSCTPANKSVRSASIAFKKYAKEIDNYRNKLELEILESKNKIANYEQEIITSHAVIGDSKQKIKEYESEIFDGNYDNRSIQEQINGYVDEIRQNHQEITNYYQRLTSDGNETSIISVIQNAKVESTQYNDLIRQNLDASKQKISDLKDFYTKIYGEANDDGETEGGLNQEIEHRMKRIDTVFDDKDKILEIFIQEQKNKYNKLVEEIEGLIHGATTVGLATAFNKKESSFNDQVQFYSKAFMGSLASLLLVALYLFFQWKNWVPSIVSYNTFLDLFQNIIPKLAVITPILWGAIFFSKRRSEAQRLENEYAHKTVVATSYNSFRKQIDESGDSKGELLGSLLDNTISAVAFNASSTLDKKHGDKIPAHELLDKLMEYFSPEQIKDLVGHLSKKS